jgi:chromosome segregation ATPase
MSNYVGEAVYRVSAETSDLIDARRDVRQFGQHAKREFNKAGRETEKLTTKIKNLSASISVGLAKGALTAVTGALTAAAAGMVLMARDAAELNRELDVQARQARLARDEFDALAFATKAYGITGEQIADISKDITDKLGEFATAGTGAFQDFADVMKMTREEAVETASRFQHMAGRDVLIEMVSQMEAAGVSSSQMTFALEALGNEASRLLPALKNNAAGLKELEAVQRQLAEQMPINAEQRQAIDDVNIALLKLDEVFIRLRDTIIANVEPYLTFLIEVYTGVGIAIGKASNAVRAFFVEIGAIEPGEVEALNMELEDLQEKMRQLVGDIKNVNENSYLWKDGAGDTEVLTKELDRVKNRIIEVNKELASLNKGGDTSERPEIVAPEVKQTGSGFTADQIEAAKKRVDAIRESLEDERIEIKKHAELVRLVEENQMSEAAAREENRYRAESERLEKHYKDVIKLREEFGDKVGDVQKEYDAVSKKAHEVHTENLKRIREQELEDARKAAAEEARVMQERLDAASSYFDKQKELAEQNMRDAEAIESGAMTREEVNELNRYDRLVESLEARFEAEKEALGEHFEQIKELEIQKNEALESIKADHEKRMTDIQRAAEDERKQMAMMNMSMVVSAASTAFGAMAGMLKRSGDEQSSAYKAMFALSKGFAIAQAGLNLSLAISNAMKDVTYPTNFAAMAQVAAAGGSLVSAISGATYGGGRQYGGPVDAGKYYEVNETGVPEIVTTGGRDYMTMGSQGGKVTPLDKAGMGNNVTVNNYGNSGVDVRQTDKGMIIDIAREEAQKARRAAVSDVAGDIRSGNGSISKSLKQSMGVQQKAGMGSR